MQKQLKGRHEFSGLLQTCMHLEQRSMPYSNVQQSMVQEQHKCTWRKVRIQNFSEWPRGTGKSHVVCLIQRDMSHFFKHTVKPDDDQPIVLITAQQDQQHFKLVDLQSIPHFYYMIILIPNLVGRRELRCN